MRILASGTLCAIILGLAIGGPLSLWGTALAQYNPYVVPQGRRSLEERLQWELQRHEYQIQEQLRQQEQQRRWDERNRRLQEQMWRQNQEHIRQQRQMEEQRQPYHYDPYRW